MSTRSADTATPQTFPFQAEANRLLHLVIHSLYTNKEVFLRELLSNASDALDKLRFRRVTEHDLVPGDHALEVRITPRSDEKILEISDSGVGMTRDELIRNLGTIAESGTRAFLEAIEKSGSKGSEESLKLIGQFGVGFYSAFLVADRVEVVSRAAGSDEAWRWTSEAQGEFTIEPAQRESAGTDVRLHLPKDRTEYLSEWRLRDLVSRYSDYIDYPILLRVSKEDDETAFEYEKINRASALWRRPKSEIEDAQYNEFYTHLTHDATEPLTRLHFTLEGTQVFTALLFVPSVPPFDLFWRERKSGLRLYVRRVFIMDDAAPFLPEWLRFVRGVVDSDDLPLNVSRETLQDSAAVRQIKKNVVNKVLAHFESVASDDKATWEKIWTHYGAVLKEGLHADHENRDRLAKIARFKASRDEDWTSLADYVARMPEGQKAIYYVFGESKSRLEGSPHVEALKSRGFEYLYLTDPIDKWAVDSLGAFEGKELVDAMSADLGLDAGDDAKKATEEAAKDLEPLLEKMREVLGESVREVRVSSRLTDSPVCLVAPTGHDSAYLERLLRNMPGAPHETKRILEVNPDHRIIRGLADVAKTDAASAELREWISVLHDQALLTEGSPLEDPNRFVRRMNQLLEAVLPKQERKSESKKEPKGESKKEPKGESKKESKKETKREPKR